MILVYYRHSCPLKQPHKRESVGKTEFFIELLSVFAGLIDGVVASIAGVIPLEEPDGDIVRIAERDDLSVPTGADRNRQFQACRIRLYIKRFNHDVESVVRLWSDLHGPRLTAGVNQFKTCAAAEVNKCPTSVGAVEAAQNGEAQAMMIKIKNGVEVVRGDCQVTHSDHPGQWA